MSERVIPMSWVYSKTERYYPEEHYPSDCKFTKGELIVITASNFGEFEVLGLYECMEKFDINEIVINNTQLKRNQETYNYIYSPEESPESSNSLFVGIQINFGELISLLTKNKYIIKREYKQLYLGSENYFRMIKYKFSDLVRLNEKGG